MFLALYARKYQMKYVKTWLLKFPDEAVPRFQLNNANPNPEMFAGIFLGTSVIRFLNRFRNKNARPFQDRFVSMYQRKNAVLFLNKNVKIRTLKIVKSNA